MPEKTEVQQRFLAVFPNPKDVEAAPSAVRDSDLTSQHADDTPFSFHERAWNLQATLFVLVVGAAVIVREPSLLPSPDLIYHSAQSSYGQLKIEYNRGVNRLVDLSLQTATPFHR